MNEQDWLANSGPAAMLREVEYINNRHTVIPGGLQKVSDRKLRLFACACARHAFKTLARPTIAMSKASILAIDYAERFADDDQSEVLKECLRLARSEALSAFNLSGLFEDELAVNCSGSIADITCNSGLPRWFSVSNKHAAAQADLLRHIVGNPFRPLKIKTEFRCEKCGNSAYRIDYIDRAICANGNCDGFMVDRPEKLPPLVLDLAQQLYDGNQDVTPVLHDALLDAAAPVELGEHFWREQARHPKGCWALDLILGKE